MKVRLPQIGLLSLALGSSLLLAACSDDKTDNNDARPNASLPSADEAPAFAGRQLKNLVDIVVSSPDFSTLKSLLIAADLVDTVKNGEFTVLAPTNAAFAKLPPELLAKLGEDKAALRQVLLYHVVAGTAKADKVLASAKLKAANGQELKISLKDGKPYVNDSAITKTDILASNGVIHVIDTVLIPSL